MNTLSADRPKTDPKDDLFGHAPFAKNLADNIRLYPDDDGLVLALYGAWGSGKSTVLNYVKHHLEQRPEEERPAIVSFNPWWFAGQDNLARAFLGQLQATLSDKDEVLRKISPLLGQYARGIGRLIDLSGMTGGSIEIIGQFIEAATNQEPDNVPEIKSKIGKKLGEAKKRIVVIIDDIDRLNPEETRQLFTVIKALADFPYVVYLLAFDRKVVAKAIEHHGCLPGEPYLEKIVQVPFELPLVDRTSLLNMLFVRLEQVLGDSPENLFDKSYWANVFHDGIAPMIRVPRNVVRLTNALSVAYPLVRGEVNPVDFIALEAVRIFIPDLHDVVRTNGDRFVGSASDDDDDQTGARIFRERWVADIPEALQASAQALLSHVFPKIDRTRHGADEMADWRRRLRACHPEIFPTYFQLAVPTGNTSQAEMMALLSLSPSSKNFGKALLRAKEERRPDGLSKARAFLERLMDHVERDIQEENVPTIVQALVDVGDELIDPADERGLFDFGNLSRVVRLAHHLLKRLPAHQRLYVLEAATRSGRAVAAQLWLLQTLEKEAGKTGESDETAFPSIDDIEQLKAVWLDRMRALSAETDFLPHQELPRLLAAWEKWAGETEVRDWCDRNTESDEGLLKFLSSCLWHMRSERDGALHHQPRLNPDRLQHYLDTGACADRLRDLQENSMVPDEARETVSQYLQEFEMLANDEDPDAFGAF